MPDIAQILIWSGQQLAFLLKDTKRPNLSHIMHSLGKYDKSEHALYAWEVYIRHQ
jgi:hypothetical protein